MVTTVVMSGTTDRLINANEVTETFVISSVRFEFCYQLKSLFAVKRARELVGDGKHKNIKLDTAGEN